VIGARPLQGFGHAATGYQCLNPDNNGKTVIGQAILAGLYFAAEFFDVGKGLPVADKRIGFGEKLVFDTHVGDAALAQLAYYAAHVVEIAIAGIPVEPAMTSRTWVQDALLLSRTPKAAEIASPDPKSGFFYDLCRQAIMRFHDED